MSNISCNVDGHKNSSCCSSVAVACDVGSVEMKYVGSVVSCGTSKYSSDAVSKYLGVWTSITSWLSRMVLRILVALLPVVIILL